MDNIEHKLSNLEHDIAKMDKYLLITGKPLKDSSIIVNLHALKRRVIRLHFMIDLHEYNNKTINKNNRDRLKKINKKIKLLDSYNSMIIMYKQKNSLDLIALVSLIFLPLTLITGYFGMNFGGMGSPVKIKGIFTIGNPNYFVFTLFTLSFIIFGILFYKFKE
tara:strand:+ start:958 stop:1446 length:489 start_codon:yes stop_codon:yes gene_type:complete